MTRAGSLAGQPLDEVDLGILRWIAQGFTHDDIRKAMSFSSTEKAKYYAQRMYRKLGADNAAHAVFLGIQAGWLDPTTGAPNTFAVPIVAADLVRNKVAQVLDEVRGSFAKEIQDQLRAWSSQFVVMITERSA